MTLLKEIHPVIITSLIDNDAYKFTMAQVVFHDFPRAIVTYEFINRGKTVFPPGFDSALRTQIEFLSLFSLTSSEKEFLNNISYMRPTFVEWFAGYRFNPEEVSIEQTGGDLRVTIKGPWYRTIFWEVPLMAIISELYFHMMEQTPTIDVEKRIEEKGLRLQTAGCFWIDFGTRRRFSYATQNAVVRKMSFMNGFLGTSNVHFAHMHKVAINGTYAHECVMAMQALVGARHANGEWMKRWSNYYNGLNGVALTDTFTTDVFLKEFGPYEARLFDGVRQDSGDPIEWGNKMLNHYRKLKIPTTNKRFVFSDALDDEKYIKLHKLFQPVAQPVGGIGTFLTNDVGANIKPLNIVIKLVSADFGYGPVDVVKLSDDSGKYTGKTPAIKGVKMELGLL